MKISTFQARDMREALKEVKEQLGPDAVILSTRSIIAKGKNGMPTGEPMIEVTACPSPATSGNLTMASAAEPSKRDSEKSSPRSAVLASGRFSAVVDNPVEYPQEEKKKPLVAPPIAPVTPMARPVTQSLASDLSNIRSTLRHLEERVSGMPMPTESESSGMNVEGKRRYSWLLMHGVEEPIARKLALIEQDDKETGLEKALNQVLKFRDPLDGKSRVIILVGPTGVGKTTTLAKIAADLMLNRQRSVGMITLDTFRVGAVAQLETYAKLLQVPLVVARTLSEVKAGLHSLNRYDYVLVDTVGTSPYNRRQVNSTGTLLPIMGEDREVILCMAGNVRESEQLAIFRRFSVLGPTGIIFTKLDETVTYGGIINVAIKAQMPLTMFTDGQRVPENLGWMSAKTLSQWFQQEQESDG
ncbi:MAG: flagellar biosynthesis protein FlhF [Magnetococcus sp. DMHC-6]